MGRDYHRFLGPAVPGELVPRAGISPPVRIGGAKRISQYLSGSTASVASDDPAAVSNHDKFGLTMLSLDDKRWQELEGGDRTRFDPRPLLLKLETSKDTKAAWNELWEGLHHQGDVGEASYAAVPHLVRIYRDRGGSEWSTYAIVATIELARASGKNPEVPEWLKEDYFHAIRTLAEVGATEVLRTKNPENIRAILSVIAIAADARTHARFLLWYSDSELLEIERLSGQWCSAGCRRS